MSAGIAYFIPSQTLFVLTRITSSKPSLLEFGDGREFAEDRGDIEDAVEPAEALDRALDETLDVGRRSDVRHDGIDFAGRRLELFLEFVELVGEPVDGDDVDAASGEFANDRRAHSPGGAGDNDILRFLGHPPSSNLPSSVRLNAYGDASGASAWAKLISSWRPARAPLPRARPAIANGRVVPVAN